MIIIIMTIIIINNDNNNDNNNNNNNTVPKKIKPSKYISKNAYFKLAIHFYYDMSQYRES